VQTLAESADSTLEVVDDLDELLEILPETWRRSLVEAGDLSRLIEVVCDLGRRPEARFPDGVRILAEQAVARRDLEVMGDRIGEFASDNRAGIERTLHRISALRNRRGAIVGLTCRVGRAVYGTIDAVRDFIESGKSVLLVGRPGVGKTTLLRDAARLLADDLDKRVMIVDTSNEIGGDGDIPHPGIGTARRIQVPSPERQHDVMIEAVENHMPEVVVIDEIGTEREALAARTIAERGVQLVATAHGVTLGNLIANPTLSDLVGGIQTVTLGDEEARRRRTQKTVLERKAPPTFEVVVEIHDRDRFAVHHDVAAVVDQILRGRSPAAELRVRQADGGVSIEAAPPPRPPEREAAVVGSGASVLKLYAYGLPRDRVERAIRNLSVPARVVDELAEADVVFTSKTAARKHARRLQALSDKGARVHAATSNSLAKIEQSLRKLFGRRRLDQEGSDALKEAEAAIVDVLSMGEPVPLAPRNSVVRRLQHELAAAYGLDSQSVGSEPARHVVLYPRGAELDEVPAGHGRQGVEDVHEGETS
jgi:stage III sporulation protein SpoIIIAA